MDNVINLPPSQADSGVSPAPEPSAPGSPAAANRELFKRTLNPTKELNEAQSPETRRAVLATLDGLQRSSGPSQPPTAAVPGHPAADDAVIPPGLRQQPGHASSGQSPNTPRQPNPAEPPVSGTGSSPGAENNSPPMASRPARPMPAGAPGTVKSENRVQADSTGSIPCQTAIRPPASGDSNTGQTAPNHPSSTTAAVRPDAAPDNPESPPQQTRSRPTTPGPQSPTAAPDNPGTAQEDPDSPPRQTRSRPTTPGPKSPTAAPDNPGTAREDPGSPPQQTRSRPPTPGPKSPTTAPDNPGTAQEDPDSPPRQTRSRPTTPGSQSPTAAPDNPGTAREDPDSPPQQTRSRPPTPGPQSPPTAPDNPGTAQEDPGSPPQQTRSKQRASATSGIGQPGPAPDKPGTAGDSPVPRQQRSGARTPSSTVSLPPQREQGRINAPSPNTDKSGPPAAAPMSADPSPSMEVSNTPAPAESRESARSNGAEAPRIPVARSAGFAPQVPEVVDRILVSIPNSVGGDEVRIQLKPSILDGSEIRIFRDAGEINIVFIPKSEASREFLTGQEARFQSILAERLNDDRIRVEVEPVNRGRTFAEDNEGRSRQQHTAEDDDPSHGSPSHGATR